MNEGLLKSEGLLNRVNVRSLDLSIETLLVTRQEYGNELYHLGLTTDRHILLDSDGLSDEEAKHQAKNLVKYIGRFTKDEVKCNLIKTNKGHHYIFSPEFEEDRWLKIYERLLDAVNAGKLKLDWQHLEISIRYASTTLRISPRENGVKEVYEVIWRNYE